jgi:hypothetical protein
VVYQYKCRNSGHYPSSCQRERERERKKVGRVAEDTTDRWGGGGGQEMSNSARKVPRQCPLVFLSTEKF